MDTTTQQEDRSLAEELRRRYREAKDPVERSHHHIAWLLAEGKSVREAAEATGYSERWVRELSRRYRESAGPRGSGIAGTPTPAVRRGRSAHPLPARGAGGGAEGAARGRRAMELAQGGRVDRGANRPTRRAGAKGLGVPAQAWSHSTSAEARERRRRPAGAGGLQKKLPGRLDELRRAHPEAQEVELWAEDGMRVGLKPVLRRAWAPRGRRPVARGRRRYDEWVYVYGFVRPETGEVFRLVMPTVNARAFSLALTRFAEWAGAGKGKRVLLLLDRAGWHVAKDLRVPEGMELEFLPARSPELMPAERLWLLVNERVANRPFEDLDELEGALVERCLALSERPDLLRGHTRYRWWPEAA